ncbi:MAG: efflux RND transporter periplasmic adaptor subunit [Rubripirellula sp.]
MVKKTITLVAVVAVTLVAMFAWRGRAPADTPIASPQSERNSYDTGVVVLTTASLEAAGVESVVVEEAEVNPVRTIAGRMEYDQDRHVSVKAACNGILTDVLVHPGDVVAAGDVVAIVYSSELALANSKAIHKFAQRDLASTEYQWHKGVCDGVAELVSLIRNGIAPTVIDEKLRREALGAYRERLVSAYTRSRLAKQVAESSRLAATRGAISSRLQQERETERQASEAAIVALLEQSHFQAKQECKEKEAELASADRELEVSIQRLNELLGPAADRVTVKSLAASSSDDDISSVKLLSPIAGTVEERLLTTNERVTNDSAIFTIADTRRLWAVGDLRNRDWNAVEANPGELVTFRVPAIPETEFTAEILFVGRRVDASSGATPIVARTREQDRRLRPGMQLRMTVPVGPRRRSLVVPNSAVVAHEGKSFVFGAESEGRFRRIDVAIGETYDGVTEIVGDIRAGDRIASTGVFKLKSALLLAEEAE